MINHIREFVFIDFCFLFGFTDTVASTTAGDLVSSDARNLCPVAGVLLWTYQLAVINLNFQPHQFLQPLLASHSSFKTHSWYLWGWVSLYIDSKITFQIIVSESTFISHIFTMSRQSTELCHDDGLPALRSRDSLGRPGVTKRPLHF